MFPNWDSDLFKLINSTHSDFWDVIMIILSNKYIWIPLYLFIIKKLIDQYRKGAWKSILYLISTVILADQVASSFFKPLVKRLRPCHVETFQSWIHLPDGCGGLYGFCSSHAANSFALAMAVYLLTKNKWARYPLFFWAFMISYSRIYLGAHYPLDVLVGAFVGILASILLYKVIYTKLVKKA